MAYSDYGAFVYKNGKRRTDKEDAPIFANDEEVFGESIDNIPSGLRIWIASMYGHKIYHGVMGDSNIRVVCYKQGLPDIYELSENNTPIRINYIDNKEIDCYDYEPVEFEYKGYKFIFDNIYHYRAAMIEPNGDCWECVYDYEYGGGFEENQ